MSIRKKQRMRWMNAAIGRVARFTRIIPKGPRRAVRDWLIRKTTPELVKEYRPPKAWIPGRYPEGINLYGFFREENGLGQGVRMYARAIEEAGIKHRFIHTSFLEWLPQEEHSFDSRLKKGSRYEINVIHINPDQWEDACRAFPHRNFDCRYNIGVWLWELNLIPEHWRRYLPYVDELWVPSEYVAGAIRRETDKPVTVIPYGIEVPVEDAGRRELGLEEDAFLVLAMFDSNSYAARKNPMGAVKAFTEAFSGRKDVRLILKVNNPHSEDVEQLEQYLKQADVQYTLITERMPKTRLNTLIKCCDVFLSLHRCEGFGLPIAEAMRLGRAVVATDWSANREFMNSGCACPVGYKLVPVGDAYQFEREGQVWADPDIHQAAEYLRRLADDAEYREKIMRAAEEYAAEHLSTARCGELMKQRVRKIRGE